VNGLHGDDYDGDGGDDGGDDGDAAYACLEYLIHVRLGVLWLDIAGSMKSLAHTKHLRIFHRQRNLRRKVSSF